MEFKIGDRVKYVSHFHGSDAEYFEIGKEYIIREILYGDIYVHGITLYALPKQLEKVPDKQPEKSSESPEKAPDNRTLSITLPEETERYEGYYELGEDVFKVTVERV